MPTGEIAKLWATIGADTKGLKKGLDESEKGLSGLKTVALGAGLALGAAAGGLAYALNDCVKAAMEAENIQADLNAVLKSTQGAAGVSADEINKMALALSGVTKFEDDAIVSGQSMLLTFTNIGKDVFPQATEAMLDMSQKFGTDLPQAAITLGKALNDPIAGVTALRRIGVQLTDTQEEQIKKFMELGDIASAQKIILGELSTEIGGVARAAGETASGKLEIFRNTIGNIKEDIGTAFLPLLAEVATELSAGLRSPEAQAMIKGLTDFIKSDVIPAFTDAATWIKENKVQIGELITQIGLFMGTPLGDALKANTALWKELTPVLQTVNDLINSINVNIGVGSDDLNIWNTALASIKHTLEVITGGPLAWYKEMLSTILSFYNQLISSGRELEKLVFSGGGNIPGFASGGIVPGLLGAPQLAIVHGGEQIIPANQTTNNWNLTINSRSPVEPLVQDFAMMRSLAGA